MTHCVQAKLNYGRVDAFNSYMQNYWSFARSKQDAPTECDHVRTVEVANGVACNAHDDTENL
jgi:hypothetical protein